MITTWNYTINSFTISIVRSSIAPVDWKSFILNYFTASPGYGDICILNDLPAIGFYATTIGSTYTANFYIKPIDINFIFNNLADVYVILAPTQLRMACDVSHHFFYKA